jgi:hypothetical protein
VPSELPFEEVWHDLLRTLAGRTGFETLARGGKFTAQIVDQRTGIRIKAPGRTTTISKDELAELWIQLRDFGLLTAAAFPANRGNVASHVMAVLSSLPYIRPLPLGEDYDSFTFNPTLGLQLLPPTERQSDQRQLELV